MGNSKYFVIDIYYKTCLIVGLQYTMCGGYGADGVYIVEIEVKAFGRKMTICPALMSVVKAQY
ncbi:hypothetical protein [Bacillus spizizenii]|uniref:hypothetical protein n=1 Tax=Bacillus spizizenii TaxID=96241 RepID=UPI002DB8C04B|nr:hypothetical protein [Bacillus spizizenii]MEC1527481.1 hypothetical protein [Bacillus spizizenii]